MRKHLVLLTMVGIAVLWGHWGVSAQEAAEKPSRLCVVWSSDDVDVAKNVCFMYTLNAKKASWFDEVSLVVWGPSAKLLAEDQSIQAEVQAMKEVGVKVEACVVCAKRYQVDDDLRGLGLKVKPMGKPLSDRLKGDWQVITF